MLVNLALGLAFKSKTCSWIWEWLSFKCFTTRTCSQTNALHTHTSSLENYLSLVYCSHFPSTKHCSLCVNPTSVGQNLPFPGLYVNFLPVVWSEWDKYLQTQTSITLLLCAPFVCPSLSCLPLSSVFAEGVCAGGKSVCVECRLKQTF